MGNRRCVAFTQTIGKVQKMYVNFVVELPKGHKLFEAHPSWALETLALKIQRKTNVPGVQFIHLGYSRPCGPTDSQDRETVFLEPKMKIADVIKLILRDNEKDENNPNLYSLVGRVGNNPIPPAA